MSCVKTYAGILGWTFVAVGVVGDTSVNILAINQADNVLHLAVGALGIGVVAASARPGTQPAEA